MVDDRIIGTINPIKQTILLGNPNAPQQRKGWFMQRPEHRDAVADGQSQDTQKHQGQALGASQTRALPEGRQTRIVPLHVLHNFGPKKEHRRRHQSEIRNRYA
jgi:hypothetical protein